MKRHILLINLIIILLIPVGLIGLMSTESGSRFLLQQVLPKITAQVTIKTLQGNLLSRIELDDFAYTSDTQTVTIAHLVFAWQPSALFTGHLKIFDLSINHVDLNIKASKDQSREESVFNIEDELRLPVQLSVDHFLLADMKVHIDNQVHELNKLQFSAATQNGQLEIPSITIATPEAEAALKGRIGLGKGYPVELNTDWKVNLAANGLWQGVTTLKGDLHKLMFDNQLTGPSKLVLQGYVTDLLTLPRFAVHGDWQKLNWPLAGSAPQIQSPQGSFELTGLMNDYHITVNSRLNQQYLPDAHLVFDGTGNLDALSIKQLELKSKTGQFQLAGDVSWQNAPAFDLTASGQNFNPAILLPEMPGSLTFNTHLKGKMDAKALQIAADINKLSGQLRGHPVSANGKLALNDDQLKVDALRIVSGANQLAVDGTLGQQQASLNIDMKLPNLDSLWPNLGGSLHGGGQFRGAWAHPAVKFSATGKRLRFAEHSAEKLEINIDYQPGTQQNSTLKLSANAIKSGATQLSKLLITGEGTTAQHRFNADISSTYGDLSTVLSGTFKDRNWLGNFSKLDLDSKQAGQWQLKNDLRIHVAQKTAGFDVSVDKSCLAQQSAALCLQGRYFVNGDLQLALQTTALPVRLIKAWLPADMDSTAIINGDADLQRQKGSLAGHYRFALPASTLTLANTDLALGASSLAGTIQGDKVFVDIDLSLSGRDSIQSQMQINIGKAQSISGQASAQIDELGLYQALVPQLTDLKGHLQADFDVKGSINKPFVTGRLDVSSGLVKTAQIHLDSINIQAQVSGTNHIKLQGSLAPKLFKPDASEPLTISSLIQIDADLQQQKNGLQGQYRLAMPGKSSLTVSNKTLVLGASSLVGNIKDDLISANLDIGLIDRDYCRGTLQIDSGKSRTLSGQMTALLSRFDFIEVFVPQLSGMKGLLTADLDINGTIQKPQVNGAVNFKNGAVAVQSLGLAVHDIHLQAQSEVAHPEHLQIKGAAKSGDGYIKLDGLIDWQAQSGSLVDLLLTGENFEIAKLPEAQIAVSPTLTLKFADNKGKVSGTVKVPKALLTLQEIPENAVKVSNDEIILGEESAKAKQPAAPGIDADIKIELGKDVSFSGQGLKTNLAGQLNVNNSAGKMTMNGNVDLNKAGYKRFGQDLTVRKGRFMFNGPADNPWLDVEAIRLSKSKKVTAVLSLTGPLRNPKTQIFSEPALPETEALAYLVTGGPLSQVSQSEGNRVASAALSYGAGQASWLANKLGIDEFGLEEGETLQDSLLAVGQYLTPDFYVGAKVGLFNKQTLLVLKHKFTETLNVETQTGTSQRIKLNYEFDTD